MRKPLFVIGFGSIAVSCVFTINFFSGFGNTGFEKIFYGGIGLLFQSAQACALIAGISLHEIGKKVVSYLMVGVFVVLCALSVFATVCTFSGDFAEKRLASAMSDPEKRRIQEAIASLIAEKKALNEQIAYGLEHLLIKNSVRPARSRLEKVESKLEKLRSDLGKHETPMPESAFFNTAAVFTGMTHDQVMSGVLLFFAVIIEAIGSGCLCAARLLSGNDNHTVSNQLVMSNRLQWSQTQTRSEKRTCEHTSAVPDHAADLFQFIKKKAPTRRQILASRKRPGAEAYDHDISQLIALGLIKVDNTPRRESDYVYSAVR